MVDAAEACLILEHKAHFSTAPVEIFQFTDGGFNFFEVSMTSSLTFFGRGLPARRYYTVSWLPWLLLTKNSISCQDCEPISSYLHNNGRIFAWL